MIQEIKYTENRRDREDCIIQESRRIEIEKIDTRIKVHGEW